MGGLFPEMFANGGRWLKSIRKFAASLVVYFDAGAVGGLYTATSVNRWYPQLIRPDFAQRRDTVAALSM